MRRLATNGSGCTHTGDNLRRCGHFCRDRSEGGGTVASWSGRVRAWFALQTV